MSLLSLGMVTIYDAYICLANLYLSLLFNAYFQFFIIPALTYFILSSMFDMRLMICVWRDRYYADLPNLIEVRKALT